MRVKLIPEPALVHVNGFKAVGDGKNYVCSVSKAVKVTGKKTDDWYYKAGDWHYVWCLCNFAGYPIYNTPSFNSLLEAFAWIADSYPCLLT